MDDFAKKQMELTSSAKLIKELDYLLENAPSTIDSAAYKELQSLRDVWYLFVVFTATDLKSKVLELTKNFK